MPFHKSFTPVPAIAAQNQRIENAKASLRRAERKLQQMQAVCNHEFVLDGQGAAFTPKAPEGTVGFSQEYFCRKCGIEKQTITSSPVCITCGVAMPSAPANVVAANHQSFEDAKGVVSLALNRFKWGQQMFYQCPICSRPHVYQACGE